MRAAPSSPPGDDIGAELVEMALAGIGWPALVRRLAELSAAPVRLIGVHGGCLAAAPNPSAAGLDPGEVTRLDRHGPSAVRCLDGWEATAMRIDAGPRSVGVLAIGGTRSANSEQLLEAARLAVAIEAVRRDAQAQARAESAGRLIDEVRFGVLRDPDEVTRIAERFGLRLDRPHVAVAFHYEGANQRTWHAALNWVEYPIRLDQRTGWTILADDVAERSRIQTRLQGMVGTDAPVVVACGSVVQGALDTPRSFNDAEFTLAVLRRSGGRNELSFDELGTLGLLISVPTERLSRFVTAKLGPILDRPELIDTLTEWYQANGSRTAVAGRLHIHRNSVGYRLAKVGELLGIELSDISSTTDLRTALTAREALCILTQHEHQTRGDPVHPKETE